MESVGKIKKAIITFLILNFGLSSVFYYLMVTGENSQFYVYLVMWCPAIAAIITSLIFYRSIREFGWRPGKVKYLIGAYSIPLIYALISFGVFWILNPGTLKGGIDPIGVLMAVISGTLTCVLTALGEEIGWRGFLVPQMAKITSFTKVALITGIIWAGWHYPGIIFGIYNADTPLWYALPVFTAAIIGMSFLLAWFRLKSGSLWPPVLFHASSNLFLQFIFDPLTMQTGITKYYLGETGVFTVVAILVFAFIFWTWRDKLPDTLIKKDQENSPS
ncbi:MAG: CPBP family intramembrane metalloprotease [Methanobacteriaceae archaeon]|jgi:membrane protease YdiL (CAAX protease family)|nr:MAG: hypothetical protein CIT01_04795 [Methanobacterium sp. BRmetb2]MCC7557152.1 CPBP family intramembrane metalloprotease [Methanobacteriaceae archaeon]